MFRTKIKVNFFHADPAGVIFFSKIFEFAHSAYEEFLSEGNLERNYFYDDDFAIPIVHSEADYFKPIFPNTEIICEIFVNELKESSFELNYHFKDDYDEDLAKVKTVHVMIDKSQWRKTKIPDDLYDYLKDFKD